MKLHKNKRKFLLGGLFLVHFLSMTNNYSSNVHLLILNEEPDSNYQLNSDMNFVENLSADGCHRDRGQAPPARRDAKMGGGCGRAVRRRRLV
jgi:hypothetical protein